MPQRISRPFEVHAAGQGGRRTTQVFGFWAETWCTQCSIGLSNLSAYVYPSLRLKLHSSSCVVVCCLRKVLQSLLSCPSGWFPQISGGQCDYGAAGCSCCTVVTIVFFEILPGCGEEAIEERLLSGLSLENIVLVDDARSPSLLLEDDEEYEALRHCGKAQFSLSHENRMHASYVDACCSVNIRCRPPWRL